MSDYVIETVARGVRVRDRDDAPTEELYEIARDALAHHEELKRHWIVGPKTLDDLLNEMGLP